MRLEAGRRMVTHNARPRTRPVGHLQGQGGRPRPGSGGNPELAKGSIGARGILSPPFSTVDRQCQTMEQCWLARLIIPPSAGCCTRPLWPARCRRWSPWVSHVHRMPGAVP